MDTAGAKFGEIVYNCFGTHENRKTICRFNDVSPILQHALSAHVRSLDHDPSLLPSLPSQDDSKYGALVLQRRILDQCHCRVPCVPIGELRVGERTTNSQNAIVFAKIPAKKFTLANHKLTVLTVASKMKWPLDNHDPVNPIVAHPSTPCRYLFVTDIAH